MPEGFFDLLVNVDVVDSNAGLAAVHKFSKKNPIDSGAYFSSFIHYDRTLSSELKDAGDEVLCSLDGHQSTSGSRASEANDVNWKAGHSPCHFYPSFNHAKIS